MHKLSYGYLTKLSEKIVQNKASKEEIKQYKGFLNNWDDSKQFNMFNASALNMNSEKVRFR